MQHRTHPAQIKNARRADIGGLPRLLLPQIGEVDMPRGEAVGLKPAATPRFGGHGVDGLQVGGNVIVWFGLPFSLDLYEQANARLHRTGQKNGVVVHHLVAIDTIDEQIMEVLATKGDMQQALLDAVKKEFA